jgi:hypothetical protein
MCHASNGASVKRVGDGTEVTPPASTPLIVGTIAVSPDNDIVGTPLMRWTQTASGAPRDCVTGKSASQFDFTCPTTKIFPFPPHREGRFAIVTDVERGMRWTQMALQTNGASAFAKASADLHKAPPSLWRRRVLRTAKSCGPDASTPASSLRKAHRPDRAETRQFHR